ncbi:ureidoglycolate amidohydrolase, partial [Sarracenia purpurea var. burkii]
HDAGLAAAELALAVEMHVLESGSIDTVGTVGILELHPGAINSIPSKSHLEIDTRDIDENRRNNVIEKIHRSALAIAQKRSIKVSEFKIINQDPPAPSDESIIKAMEAASQELNLAYKLMISRAYHDSLFMARISPMGMIFIPCYKGYSHRPEEFASNEDIANGVKVLALTLSKLSLC